MLIPLISPIKVAFAITTASLLVRITAYSIRMSVFPRAGVVISFSSGIMILFCYCAIITNYERKNTTRKILIISTVILVIALQTTRNNTQTSNNTATGRILRSSPFLLLGIIVIVVAMVCINKVMYSPKKAIISTY